MRGPAGSIPTSTRSSVNPGNPTQIFEGSDGGVIRTSGTFVDVSGRLRQPVPQRRRAAAAVVRQLPRLQAVAVAGPGPGRPHRQEAEQHASVHQRGDQPDEVVPGHGRDAGQRHLGEPDHRCDRNTWPQSSTATAATPASTGTNRTWRANEFTSGFGDSNFENGDPDEVGHHHRPDPQPAATAVRVLLAADRRPEPGPGHPPDLHGGLHVWRSWAFGAGTPGAGSAGHDPERRRSTRRTVRSSSPSGTSRLAATSSCSVGP